MFTLFKSMCKFSVSDLEQESRVAIEGGSAAQVDYDPSNFHLEENEERTMIDKASLEDPKVKKLQKVCFIANLISIFGSIAPNRNIRITDMGSAGFT